jgi:hypothetical protein
MAEHEPEAASKSGDRVADTVGPVRRRERFPLELADARMLSAVGLLAATVHSFSHDVAITRPVCVRPQTEAMEFCEADRSDRRISGLTRGGYRGASHASMIIYANAVPPCLVSFQRLQPIARRKEPGHVVLTYSRWPFGARFYPMLWVHLRDGKVAGVYAKRYGLVVIDDDIGIYNLSRTREIASERPEFKQLFPD